MNTQLMTAPFLAASLLMMGTSQAQAADPVAVGEAAPKFVLPDQTGQEVSLATLLKQKPVALVFYRSADW